MWLPADYPWVFPASTPPSTMKSAPVQYDDLADARNATISATSSARAMRPIGVDAYAWS